MSAEAVRHDLSLEPETPLEAAEALEAREAPAAADTALVVAPALPEVEFIETAPAAEAKPNEPVWQIIPCLPRHDSLNHSDLMQEVHSILAEGARFVALDLTQTRFFSLNAIQLCVSLARDLASDDGSLALVGCPERTKRHFEIYGSLNQIVVARTTADLVKSRPSTVVVRPRTKLSSQEA